MLSSNARIQLPKEAYPENCLSERVEKEVHDELPALPALDHAKCSNERLAIFQLSVAVAYLQFTSHTPDPFGDFLEDEIAVCQEIKNLPPWVSAKQSPRAVAVL